MDTFRKEYKKISDENSALILSIKKKFEEVEALLLTVKSREMSTALTNLEQSCMWATKAIVLEDQKTAVS